MQTLFYILVVAQIALGLYSLWDGFVWFRMVRQRIGTHSGFYTPATALICPCKGNERGLEENLMSLTRFDYPNYEIYFAVATSLDPAIKIIERVKIASSHPVHIVIAGPPTDCGEKVYNLQRAVEALPAEKFEVLAFTDSDVRLSKGWLNKLIAPLQDGRIGATTAYRWIIPSGSGADMIASAFASAWNAAIVTMLGKPAGDFCWGGGTAIRRKTFDDIKVLESWKGAVSDDFANRQILITRVYSPRRWQMGFAVHLSYCLTLLFGIYVIFYCMADGVPWGQLFALLLAIPLLAAMKGALRTIVVGEAMPVWKAKINQYAWVWPLLAPLVPFLFVWNFVMSLITKRIRWRGIRYELLSPNMTRIVKL